MKRPTADILFNVPAVAPRTGAWIETLHRRGGIWPGRVAPRTGAWIETPPIRGHRSRRGVAPRTGAWIETRA